MRSWFSCSFWFGHWRIFWCFHYCISGSHYFRRIPTEFVTICLFEFTIFFNYSALLSHSLRWGSRQFLFGSPPCWCVLTGFPYSCALRAPYILLVISSFSKFGLFISEYFCPQFVQSEIATMGFPLLSTRGHGIYSASPWTIGFLIFSTGYGIIILFICSYISNPSLSLFSVGVPDLNTFRMSTWQFRLNIYE